MFRAKFLEEFERTVESKEWLQAFSTAKGVSAVVGRKRSAKKSNA